MSVPPGSSPGAIHVLNVTPPAGQAQGWMVRPWGPYETDYAYDWGRASATYDSSVFQSSGFGSVFDVSGRAVVVQSFLAVDTTINRAAIYLQVPSGTLPSDSFVCEIRNDNSGTPGSTVLGSATCPFSTVRISPTQGYAIFDFSSISVTPGTRYWMCFSVQSGTLRFSYGVEYVYCSSSSAAPYPSTEFSFVGATATTATTDYRPFGTTGRMATMSFVGAPGLVHQTTHTSGIDGTGDNADAPVWPASGSPPISRWTDHLALGAWFNTLGFRSGGDFDGRYLYWAGTKSNASTATYQLYQYDSRLLRDIALTPSTVGDSPKVNVWGAHAAQCYVRSNGTAIVVYQAPTETISGTAYRRVGWQTCNLSTGVYGTAHYIGTGVAHHFEFVEALKDASELVHIFYQDFADTSDLNFGLYHVAVDTSDTQGTSGRFDYFGGGNRNQYSAGMGCAWNGGVAIPYFKESGFTSNQGCMYAAYFPSDLTTTVPTIEELPTPQPNLVIRSHLGVPTGNTIADTTLAGNAGYPGCFGTYGNRLYFVLPLKESVPGSSHDAGLYVAVKDGGLFSGLYGWFLPGFSSWSFDMTDIRYFPTKQLMGVTFWDPAGYIWFGYYLDPASYPAYSGCSPQPITAHARSFAAVIGD